MELLVNKQPREPLSKTDGRKLDVVRIWETIQGEGPLAGMPAVFIRLAGCNLECPFCDTDYTSGRGMMAVESIYSQVDALIGKKGLVVITGGEPFRQNLTPLIELLVHEAQWQVQVETNGCFYWKDFPYQEVLIVCSPKTPTIHAEMEHNADALKYVISAKHMSRIDGLPTRVLGSDYTIARPWDGWQPEHIYIQPEDSVDPKESQDNIRAAVSSCMKFGYRLSLQTHKLLGLD